MEKQIVQWLLDCGVLSPEDSFLSVLPDSLYEGIEFGQKLDSILQYKSSLQRSESSKRSNWDTLEAKLRSIDYELPAETKASMMSGNKEAIFKFLQSLYYRLKPQKNTGLIIERIDTKKAIRKTDNCLEAIVVAVSRAFKTSPKQSLALLAQGNRMLAHVIIKGYKKDFQPVLKLTQLLMNDLEHLVGLAVNEGVIQMVLSVVRPGILSKSDEVMRNSFEIIVNIVKFSIKCGLRFKIIEWFNVDGIDGIYNSVLIHKNKAAEASLPLIQELNSQCIKGDFKILAHSTNEYLRILSYYVHAITKYPGLQLDLIKYSIELAMENSELLISSLVICSILNSFYDQLSQKQCLTLLNTVNNITNKPFLVKITTITELFRLLETLYSKNREIGLAIFKSLLCIFNENARNTEIRECFSNNLIFTMETEKELPIESLIEEIYSQKNVNWNVCDYDLAIAISRYPVLDVLNAVKMLNLLGNLYTSVPFYASACILSFTILLNRFKEEETIKNYMFNYAKSLISSKNDSLIYNILSKVLQISPFPGIKEMILEENYLRKQKLKTDSAILIRLLKLYGNASLSISEYEKQKNISYTVDIYKSSTQKLKKILNNPRADLDINNIKIKRQSQILLMEKRQQLTRYRSERILQQAQKEIEKRKIEIDQNKGQTIEGKICEIYDFSQDPPEECAMMAKVIRSFKRPLKYYYKLVTQDPQKKPFAKLLQVLRERGINKDRLGRDELQWFMSKYDSFRWDSFLSLLSQLSVWVFRNDLLASKLPSCHSFFSFLRELKENDDKFIDTEGELVSFITSQLKEDPEFPIPPNYAKKFHYEFSLTFSRPGVPSEYSMVSEILDEIVFESVGVHILLPSMKATKTLKVQGTVGLNPIPLNLKVSTFIKYNMAMNASDIPMNLLAESGKVLEDVLHSVSNDYSYNFYVQSMPTEIDNKDEGWNKYSLEVKERLKQLQELKEKADAEERIKNEKKLAELKETERKKLEKFNKIKSEKKKMLEVWRDEQNKLKEIELKKEEENFNLNKIRQKTINAKVKRSTAELQERFKNAVDQRKKLKTSSSSVQPLSKSKKI